MPNYKIDSMERLIDDNTQVIIVAIENYRYDKISKVKYALNDAKAFEQFVLTELNISPSNIKTYYDNLASKTVLEDELKHNIRNLTEDDKFIFYYAGHGFYGDGTNKLTAWDTVDTNFIETTISLNDILTEPLKESKCKRSLIFIDACSKYIYDNIGSRDAITNLNSKELEYLVNQTEYCGLFMSCSPGEKSYSNDNIQHGIWTYHLLQALKGEDRKLLVDNKYITDTYLRDYLSQNVPKFISKNTDIRDSQTPLANLTATNSFIIHEIKEITKTESDNNLPSLNVSIDCIRLLNRENIHSTKASGFKSSHWAPDRVGSTWEQFIRGVFTEEVSDEIQNIYEETKLVLNLRRGDITKDCSIEGGTLKNKYFNYELSLTQSTSYPAYGHFTRELIINDVDSINPDFDSIFPKKMNNIFVDCDIEEDKFEDTVEQFENLADLENGKVKDDDRNLTLTYNSIDGMKLTLQFKLKRILISTESDYKMKDFIQRTFNLLNKIAVDELK